MKEMDIKQALQELRSIQQTYKALGKIELIMTNVIALEAREKAVLESVKRGEGIERDLKERIDNLSSELKEKTNAQDKALEKKQKEATEVIASMVKKGDDEVESKKTDIVALEEQKISLVKDISNLKDDKAKFEASVKELKSVMSKTNSMVGAL